MQAITWVVAATSDISWYRPVYSPDGKTLLFERTTGGQTLLYTCPVGDGSNPVPFLQDVPSGLKNQTRPDWSRSAGNWVAFADPSNGIWLTDENGEQTQQLANTGGMTYPSWYPGAQSLAVMVTGQGEGPYTAQIDRDGKFVQRLMPDSLFAGMPSISQANSADLAFPGQKAVPPYNQDNNKIYISTAPSNATLLDSSQGRAPWWSPDGALVAFESDRSGGGHYAIYVAKPDGSGLQQLTDPSVGAEHPKFSPDGKNIVFAGFQNPGDKKYSIGIIPFTA